MLGAAVTLYDPLTRPFRIFSGVVIFLLVCFLGISLWDPEGLTDPARQRLGLAAYAIVLVAVIASFIVSRKWGIWKWKRKPQVELADGKIVVKMPDCADVGIPISEIHTIREVPGWLVIRGGEPLKVIPREVRDYEGLRRELASHPTARLCLYFSSHMRVVQLACGAILFLWFAWGFHSLWKIFRAKKMGWLVLSSYTIRWLVLGWVMFKGLIR